jgi:RimJ/RimL family protein N-acetyltransferase
MIFNRDMGAGMTQDEHAQTFVGEPPLLVHRLDGVAVVVEQKDSLRALFARPAPDQLRLVELSGRGHTRAVLAMLQANFEWSNVYECSLELDIAPAALRAELLQRGACEPGQGHASILRCRRGALAQLPDLWLCAARAADYPQRLVVTEGKRHPQRPQKPAGVVYQRRVAALGATLSLRVADVSIHLEAFHRWMNEPRVSRIWELAAPKAELAQYLEKVVRDPHTLPLIGEWDGESFGYFELYWAKEDRIAPFYQVADYDRGVHVLVGEQRYRGAQRVAAWLSALAHYTFLDDPRTQHLVAEPRADNAKMIAYFMRAGFHREKAFDFPHKRAALMKLPREVFFDEHCP